MDNANTETAAQMPALPTVASLSAATETSSFFPFLRMPTELRNMVYRMLLVSRHRIHVECLTKNFCKHRLAISTNILRVCRQIIAEALNVLYGENNFVTIVYGKPPTIVQSFSPPNLMRLRNLTFAHPCIMHTLDVDPDYENGSDWGGSSIDSAFLDSDHESDGDHERYLAPMQVDEHALPLSTWRPILANLTRFTIILMVVCCDKHTPLDHQSILAATEELKDYNRREIKKALCFYDLHVPGTVAIHRRVRCDDHACFCSIKDKNCNRIQRYVKELWLGDSKSGKATGA
jgi:hypothetical protein